MVRHAMGYRFLEHSTDAAIEVRADTMAAALEDAAYSAIDIMLDRDTVRPIKKRDVCVESTTTHEMLYLWLEEIIYQVVTEGFAIKSVRVDYTNTEEMHIVRATLDGEPLDIITHKFGVEIKAPTYHQMRITESGGVALRFLMDL